MRQFVRRVLADRLAQERDALHRPVQLHIVDSKPETDTAHTGPELSGSNKRLGGIVEFRLRIIGKSQVYVGLGQFRLEAQNSPIFTHGGVELSILLILLSGEKVLLNGGAVFLCPAGRHDHTSQAEDGGKRQESPVAKAEHCSTPSPGPR